MLREHVLMYPVVVQFIRFGELSRSPDHPAESGLHTHTRCAAPDQMERWFGHRGPPYKNHGAWQAIIQDTNIAWRLAGCPPAQGGASP